MAMSFLYQCSNQEHEALDNFIDGLGLRKEALSTKATLADNPKEGPGCYLTFLQQSELNPYGNHGLFAPVIDPLLNWDRCFFNNPYFVIGNFHLNTDVPEVSNKIKPYFREIKKWVANKWAGRDNIFISDHANELIECGAIELNFWCSQSGDELIEVPSYLD